MEKLKQTDKITLATLKSFAKRNQDNLYIINLSDFDGMTDMVERNTDAKWRKTKIIENTNYYKTDIEGLYTVGSSRDYFSKYENDIFIGIKVYNCCGSAVLAIKK
jgi:hypothetical protein